jgi:hypothetical protein
MNSIKKFSLYSFLAGAMVAALLCLGLYLFWPEDRVDSSEQAWNMFARSLVFTKVDADGLETFKDTSMMHGPRSYYFQSEDVGRLVQWLRLKPRKGVPQEFGVPIKTARSETRWPFNWETQDVFLIYHCGRGLPMDSEQLSFDMILVDEKKVIYMTDAWTARGKDVDDPMLCLP